MTNTDPVEGARDWLMRRALQALPHEACGFILKDGTVVEIPNASTDPGKSFTMSRRHLTERVSNPADIEAIWHTHPSNNPKPSAGDLDFIPICQWRYLIVTSRQVIEYDPKICAPQDNSFWGSFSA